MGCCPVCWCSLTRQWGWRYGLCSYCPQSCHEWQLWLSPVCTAAAAGLKQVSRQVAKLPSHHRMCKETFLKMNWTETELYFTLTVTVTETELYFTLTVSAWLWLRRPARSWVLLLAEGSRWESKDIKHLDTGQWTLDTGHWISGHWNTDWKLEFWVISA